MGLKQGQKQITVAWPVDTRSLGASQLHRAGPRWAAMGPAELLRPGFQFPHTIHLRCGRGRARVRPSYGISRGSSGETITDQGATASGVNVE